MLLGDDDRPTRDEKRVTALFLLGFFFTEKEEAGGENRVYMCRKKIRV